MIIVLQWVFIRYLTFLFVYKINYNFSSKRKWANYFIYLIILHKKNDTILHLNINTFNNLLYDGEIKFLFFLVEKEMIACRIQGFEDCKSSPASCSPHELLPFKSTKIREVCVLKDLSRCSACSFLNSKALEASAPRWTVLKMNEEFVHHRKESTVRNARSYPVLSIY